MPENDEGAGLPAGGEPQGEPETPTGDQAPGIEGGDAEPETPPDVTPGEEAEVPGGEPPGDDRPEKNRIGELERKLDQATKRNDRILSLLSEQQPERKQGGAGDKPDGTHFQELDPVKIAEEVNVESKVITRIVDLIENRMDRRIHQVDQESQQVRTERARLAQLEAEAIATGEELFGTDEVGHIAEVIRDASGRLVNVQIKRNEPLYQRANAIWKASPSLRTNPSGIVVAISKAKEELEAKKNGGAKKPNAVDKTQRMLGGDAPGGGSRKLPLKQGGKFTRALTDAEYEGLSREDRLDYLRVERQFHKAK